MSIPRWLLAIAALEVNWYATVALWWMVVGDRRPDWPSTRLAHFMMCELRPLFAPAVVVLIADDAGHHRGPFRIGLDCFALLNLCFNDKDDDRWKRRKAKLASKVQQVGSRLIVVPSSA